MSANWSVSMCFIVVALIGLLDKCAGQLSFHTDANENSYTIKTPGVQQSFTRYFGGQRGNLLQQNAEPLSKYKTNQLEQQQQPQKQQQLTLPQQYQHANGLQEPAAYAQPSAANRYSYVQQASSQVQAQPQAEQSSVALENLQSAYNNYQSHRQAYAQEHQLQQMQDQSRLRQQQQQYQQAMLLRQLYQQNRPLQNGQTSAPIQAQPAHTNQQQQQQSGYYTAEQYAQYLQQQQDSVMKQQHEQLQQQYFQRGGNTAQAAHEAPVNEKLLGVQYSPSDQVSHVNFASGNLKYNF